MTWTAREYDQSDVYSGHATDSERRRVTDVLARGYAPLACVEDARPHGGAALLVEHLRSYEPPTRAELEARLRAFTDRPRPTIPDTEIHTHPTGQSVGWVNPARVLLKLEGTASFIHDNSHNARRQRTSPDSGAAARLTPFDGVIDLAERILAERGDPDGLHELLGVPEVGATEISVEAWYVGEMNPFFRVDINGNHRLAALAILEAPCVLAEVQQVTGPYLTKREAGASDEQYDQMVAYHRLLHVGEAAAFHYPGPWPMGPADTEWPILLTNPTDACRSLRAAEQLTSSQRPATIGWIPSGLFGAPQQLNQAAQQLPHQLNRIADQLAHKRRKPWWKA